MNDALDRLIEAVEAGNEDFVRSDGWILAWEAFYPEPNTVVSNGTALRLVALKAYNGSLDAAAALHEALLPGWLWDVWHSCSARVTNDADRSLAFYGSAPEATPAGAWLLAILRAYRSTHE